ncbi:hypothetical protein F5883DRAFT_185195 [Diaporthe sp. PMI_573]|nr:hypothetical protein F5883DRAFT_185195 [Diaporthaceae sp. PMI_573]
MASGTEGQSTGDYAREILPEVQRFPSSKIIDALLPIPAQRHPRLNPSSTSRLYTSRIQNLAACLIQISGDEAREPCGRCKNRKGLWLLCVVSSVPIVRAATRGACANCYYNGKARGCEMQTAGGSPEERPVNIAWTARTPLWTVFSYRRCPCACYLTTLVKWPTPCIFAGTQRATTHRKTPPGRTGNRKADFTPSRSNKVPETVKRRNRSRP